MPSKHCGYSGSFSSIAGSKTRNQSRNPAFDEKLFLTKTNCATDELEAETVRIIVFDMNSLQRNARIGQHELDLWALYHDGRLLMRQWSGILSGQKFLWILLKLMELLLIG